VEGELDGLPLGSALLVVRRNTTRLGTLSSRARINARGLATCGRRAQAEPNAKRNGHSRPLETRGRRARPTATLFGTHRRRIRRAATRRSTLSSSARINARGLPTCGRRAQAGRNANRIGNTRRVETRGRTARRTATLLRNLRRRIRRTATWLGTLSSKAIWQLVEGELEHDEMPFTRFLQKSSNTRSEVGNDRAVRLEQMLRSQSSQEEEWEAGLEAKWL
jgi:hypothetical protein